MIRIAAVVIGLAFTLGVTALAFAQSDDLNSTRPNVSSKTQINYPFGQIFERGGDDTMPRCEVVTFIKCRKKR